MGTATKLLGRMGLTRSRGKEADFCGASNPPMVDTAPAGLVEGLDVLRPLRMLGTATQSWAELACDSVLAVDTLCNVSEGASQDPTEDPTEDAVGPCAMAPYAEPATPPATLDAEGVMVAARARLAELYAAQAVTARARPWLNVGRAAPGMWWWEVIAPQGLVVLDDGEAPAWREALTVGLAALHQALLAALVDGPGRVAV